MLDENHIKAFEDYLRQKQRKRSETIKTYLWTIRTFLTVINKQPKSITKDDLDKWTKYCSKYQNNSLTPKYGAVKKYIDFLIDEDILPEEFYGVALRRLKAPKLQFDESNLDSLVLKPQQHELIFETAKKRNFMHYAIFKTAFWCMLRRCEARGLNLSDIKDIKKLQLRADITKGGKPATINISGECLDILREYIDKHRGIPKQGHEEAIFLYEGQRLSNTKLWEIIKEYRVITGFNDFHFHQWRHTGITEYARVEKDVKKVQTQARHDDPKTTMRYINYASQEYEQSYSNFEKSLTKRQQHPETEIPERKPQPPKDVAYSQPRNELLQLYKDGLLTYAEFKELLSSQNNHKNTMYG
jgi:integrase